MQKWHRKQNKKYMSKVSVAFVKCCEWRVAACNCATLDRCVCTAGGLCHPHCPYDVTTIPASVLPRYWVVDPCPLPFAIPYDTTLMLFQLTSSSGDRASPLSVSDLPPQALQTSRQNLMGVSIIQKKIDFKQTIINFEEKTILASLVVGFMVMTCSE